jgi:hypothetical protein
MKCCHLGCDGLYLHVETIQGWVVGWEMNWKGFGRKWSLSRLGIIPEPFGGSEEIHEEPQSAIQCQHRYCKQAAFEYKSRRTCWMMP